MYYIIVDEAIHSYQYSAPTQDELQKIADEYNTPVYVISGEHSGMTAEPQPKPPLTEAQREHIKALYKAITE